MPNTKMTNQERNKRYRQLRAWGLTRTEAKAGMDLSQENYIRLLYRTREGYAHATASAIHNT